MKMGNLTFLDKCVAGVQGMNLHPITDFSSDAFLWLLEMCFLDDWTHPMWYYTTPKWNLKEIRVMKTQNQKKHKFHL